MMSQILESAAKDIQLLKAAIQYKSSESIVCELRGYIKGKLQAATLLTSNEYDWDEEGIYENHGDEPIIKV